MGPDMTFPVPEPLPIYERPGREYGSEWTPTERPCQNCEQTSQALIAWTDGTRLCVSCSRIRRHNLRTAAASHREGEPDAG
jgi:hypothetical protein